MWDFATVPMQDADMACRELDRSINELGLRGVQIGSNVNGLNLGDAQFRPFFRHCAELGIAVFIHPWQMMGQDDMKKYWLPWLVGMPAETARAAASLVFSGLFQELPALKGKIALAHGGGSFPWTIGRMDHGHAVRPDLCAIDNTNSPSHHLRDFSLRYPYSRCLGLSRVERIGGHE